MVSIVVAHSIPYVATASVGYVDDFRKKVEKAKAATAVGPAYLHVHIPCPTGWGNKPAQSIEVAKLAVQSLCWPLYEIINGDEYKITVPVAKPKPVADYLKLQKRFADVNERQTEDLQVTVEKEYARLVKKTSW